MKVSLEQIKQLREATSLGVADCRNALEEAKGDMQKALEILKRKGLESVAKKQNRATLAGRIASYIHFDHKIGVVAEINSETDFVARNEEFIKFSSDVAMHIAAMAPRYIKREDVPQEVIKEEACGDDFYKNNCLLEQPFVKNPSLTVKDYLNSIIAKVGENIVVRRFARFRVGE
jgi:elongation factor Ts